MKESFYFPHDYDAQHDDKIIRLRWVHGWEGFWLYWAVIERLAIAGGKLHITDLPPMAFDMNYDPKKLEEIVTDFELFEVENDEFYSVRLLEHLAKRDDIKAKRQQAGSKWWSKSQANARAKSTKGKESKGKEIKIKETNYIYPENSFEFQAATYFIDKKKDYVQVQNQISKPDYIQKQCNEVRKLMDIDGLSENDIKALIAFAVDDDFWKDQILSISKLRKKNKDGVPYWAVLGDKVKKKISKTQTETFTPL